MKIRWLLAVLLCMALTLSACGGGKPEDAQGQEADSFTWQIELRKSEIVDGLHTDEGVQQYEGDVLDVAHDNAPSEGNVFLILTMTVTKTQTGGEPFDWKKLTVMDADGNTYARLENDSFLSVHTYKRLPGTALQIGENKGSICFEIPQNTDRGGLKLCYDAGAEGVQTLSIG